MKKTIFPALFFFLLCNSIFAQQVYVTFQEGGEPEQRSFFSVVDELSVHLPLHVVAKERLRSKGEEHIGTQTQLSRPFSVVYSDSLFQAYHLPGNRFTFLYFDNNQKLTYQYGMEKLLRYPAFIRTLPPVSSRKAQLFRFDDFDFEPYIFNRVRLRNEAHHYALLFGSKCLVVDIRRRSVHHFYTRGIHPAPVYQILFADTTQADIMLQRRQQTISINPYDCFFIDEAAFSGSNLYLDMAIPYYTNDTITGSLHITTHHALFKYSDDSLKVIAFTDSLLSVDYNRTEGALMIPRNDTLLYVRQHNENRLNNAIFSITIGNDTAYSNGIFRQFSILQENVFPRPQLYEQSHNFLYADNCLFFIYANQLYSIPDDKIIPMSSNNSHGKLCAVWKEKDQIQLLYQNGNNYELCFYQLADNNVQLLHRLPVLLNRSEIRSEIVFRNSNHLVYLNKNMQLIDFELQKY